MVEICTTGKLIFLPSNVATLFYAPDNIASRAQRDDLDATVASQ